MIDTIFRALRKPTELDEVEAARRRERGARAEALLRDEMLQEAFREVEGVYLRAWRASHVDDVEMRERAHVAVLLLDDIRNHLLNTVREGRAAQEQITRDLQRR